MLEKLYFETIKKKHDIYYTEYHPPMNNSLFATLSITFIYPTSISTIIDIVEKEALHWFELYPLPLMTSTFNEYGDFITLKDDSHFTLIKKDNTLKKYWTLLKNDSFPDGIISNQKLLEIYKDISYRTQEKVSQDARERLKPMIIWKKMYIVWILYIPIIVAIIGFYSPTWLAFGVMVYSIYKAIIAYRKDTGKIKKSKKEKEKEEKERKKDHYYVHCEENPEKFNELKCENFKKERNQDIIQNFNSLE